MSPDDTPTDRHISDSAEEPVARELLGPMSRTRSPGDLARRASQTTASGREVLDIDPDELTEDDLFSALNDAMVANEEFEKRRDADRERRRRPRHRAASRPRLRVSSRPEGPPKNVKRESSSLPPRSSETRQQVADLEAKLKESESESEKYQKRLGQMSAETVSYRKRLEAQAEQARRQGQRDVFNLLIQVIDNFESALKSSEGTADAATVLEGLHMVLRQMFTELKSLGLTTFECVGEPFDPSRHEALRNVSQGTVEPGSVAEQLRRGFMLDGQVYRAAMVAVEVDE